MANTEAVSTVKLMMQMNRADSGSMSSVMLCPQKCSGIGCDMEMPPINTLRTGTELIMASVTVSSRLKNTFAFFGTTKRRTEQATTINNSIPEQLCANVKGIDYREQKKQKTN